MKVVSNLLMRFLMIIITFLAVIACDKDGKSLLFPAIFDCEVEGVLYQDYRPYWIPSGLMRTPDILYKFDGKNKEIYFYSRVRLIDTTKSEVRMYTISINIPLDAPLELNREYLFKAIPGEDYRMKNADNYSDEGLPYCYVYAESYWNYRSFGTGKIIIESFNEKRTRVNGMIEFTIPSPVPDEEGKVLTFKGPFEQVFVRND